jgi:hypothetical protein
MKRTPRPYEIGKEKVLDATNLNEPQARLLVANYYAAQEARKRMGMQIRHLGPERETAYQLPAILMVTEQGFLDLENGVKKALLKFSESRKIGQWCLSNLGVGEVITAGCIAYLDITQSPTSGHFISFAGLNPHQEWKKGEKRPYCAAMKQIMFHFGQSMVKLHNRPDCYYGGLYSFRKQLITERNENLFYEKRAREEYYTKSADQKKYLEQGKLPPSNLERQACNYAGRIFLSHLHAVMYWDKFGEAPPLPHPIVHLGHAHILKVPNTAEFFPGFDEAYYGKRPVGDRPKKLAAVKVTKPKARRCDAEIHPE